MAHEIAVQLTLKTPADAAVELAGHIRRFWDPRMRAKFVGQVAHATTDLDPVVVMAADLVAAQVVSAAKSESVD